MIGLNGLIGKDVRYSFSKIIHEMISTTPYELYSFKNISEFFHLDFQGINITNPYKQEIIKYLDVIEQDAQNIQAVNTVIKKNNKLYGYNTDIFGFLKTLQKFKINPQNKNILILGNGATASMIEYALKSFKPQSIHFLVRTKRGQNQYLVAELPKVKDYQIIINATPVGTMLNEEIPFNLELAKFISLETVIDLNYNPLSSPLLIQAKSRQVQTVNGLYMLVAQALQANFLLNQNQDILLKIDSIHQQVLQEQTNLVLIGMPNAGKTTIGKKLAAELNKEFLDTDEVFNQTFGQSPEDFLKKNSEGEFRNKEASIITSLKNIHDTVIATGGGVILKDENMFNLQKNGIIIYLHKDLDELEKLDFSNRPLVTNQNMLSELYYQRIDKYYQYADIVIENNNQLEEAILEIKVRVNEIFNH